MPALWLFGPAVQTLVKSPLSPGAGEGVFAERGRRDPDITSEGRRVGSWPGVRARGQVWDQEQVLALALMPARWNFPNNTGKWGEMLVSVPP